jgi:asparagine synthase (glutamine-hydrolysing)
MGGDELFGGYSSFWRVPQMSRLGQTLSKIPLGKASARAALGTLSNRRGKKFELFLRRASTLENAYLVAKSQFLDDALRALMASDLYRASEGAFDAGEYLMDITRGNAGTPANTLSLLELRVYMHNQLLRDTDAMSMAHSLEVRAPLLDHVLIEFLARVPARLKFNATPKHLLIQAMRDVLPREVLERSKMPFTFPFEEWFRNEWRPAMEDILLDSGADDLFDATGIAKQWHSFLRGGLVWTQIWAAVVLRLWTRHHIAQKAVPQF